MANTDWQDTTNWDISDFYQETDIADDEYDNNNVVTYTNTTIRICQV